MEQLGLTQIRLVKRCQVTGLSACLYFFSSRVFVTLIYLFFFSVNVRDF